MGYLEELRSTRNFLQNHVGDPPQVALVLGSGLSEVLLEELDVERLAYQEIPHFPLSGVVGHAGELIWGEYAGTRFSALAGRVHLYEGIPARRVVFAVRALALWGVENFVITNAAGAIHREFEPGDLMLIRDHINLMGDNPLIGDNLDELGARFPDMSEAYSRKLMGLARGCAAEMGLGLKKGVYIGLRGPCYETPAEIAMCRSIGADAVGMSTVPEVIALNQMKREVLGISCLTNMAAGIAGQPLVHEEVLEVTSRVRRDFSKLILHIIEKIGGQS